jgi:hypothetical protein
MAITFFALAPYIVAAGVRDLQIAARPETSLIGSGLMALQRSSCRYWRSTSAATATAGQPACGDRCRRDQALRLALYLNARRTRAVCAYWLGVARYSRRVRHHLLRHPRGPRSVARGR